MSEVLIEDSNLSHAWGRALRLISRKGVKEATPLIVSIIDFDENGDFLEDASIRQGLDTLLCSLGLQSISTVGGTIFPTSMWNCNAPRSQLFSRYERMIPRLKSIDKRNRKGLYFERMISAGPESQPNQLEYVLNHYRSRKGVRRNSLQVAIYNSKIDLTQSARLGFPCMQHLTFAPTSRGGLSLNAFYADQHMISKGYGNYVGLCNLGKFIAHELGLKLERVTCYAGIAQLDVNKEQVSQLLGIINNRIGTDL